MRSYFVKKNHIGSAVSKILQYRFKHKHFVLCYEYLQIFLEIVNLNVIIVDQSDNSDNEAENDEADVLYYYNPTSSQQNIDAVSDSGNQDIEKVSDIDSQE